MSSGDDKVLRKHLAHLCPICEEETLHEVLKYGKQNITVKCSQCGHVSTVTQLLREESKRVNVIVSKGAQSEKRSLEIPVGYLIKLWDVLRLPDGEEVEVTGIELEDGRRVERAEASRIRTIWTSSLDSPVELVAEIIESKRETGRKEFRKVLARRGDVFRIGDILRLNGDMAEIVAIRRIDNVVVRRGEVRASRIKRLLVSRI